MNLPPDASRIIEGLRDTGYDFNTSIADIIDNSISHGKAKNVDIDIIMDFDGNISVMIADNGIGMNQGELVNAMRYGSQSIEDLFSLGKFGLGLKTASTAYCRRLSVISKKSKNQKIRKATWDLDHIAKVNDWELLDDEEIAPLEKEKFDKVAKKGIGTLVIWEKVDRAIKEYGNPSGHHAKNALNKIIINLEFHISMVYQKFIDKSFKKFQNINITVNGKIIEPWDPFCIDEKETELLAEESKMVGAEDGEEIGEFSLKAYALPNKYSFSSDEALKKARVTNNMQGFYVYRHGRLIFNSSWFGIHILEPHSTLFRVELNFDHTLDEAFQLDIKKSRILLNEAILYWLKNSFLPAPRRAAVDKYRKSRRSATQGTATSIHDQSNVLIRAKESEVGKTQVEVINPETGEIKVTNPKGESIIILKMVQPDSPDEVFVKPVSELADGLLWEPAIINKNKAVLINTGHEFYDRVYIPNRLEGATIQGLDSLLWALCEAELYTVDNQTQRYFKDLRYEVSRILRTLVADLPEGNIEP